MRKTLLCSFICTIASLGASTVAAAQCSTPGCLDSTFGTNGEVVTTAGQSSYAVKVSSETFLTTSGMTSTGIVAAAQVYLSGNPYLGAVRHTPSGALDPSFGNGGIAVTSVAGYTQGLAVQSDGKVLVVGFGGLLLLRFNTDGTLDSGFGNHGVVSITTKRNPPAACAVTVQSDGKIVVAGEFGGMTAWRFLTNGSLDSTFGSGGSATVSFGRNTPSRALAVALQTVGAEQRILLGGWASPGGIASADNFAIARLTSTGARDTTFGSSGTVTRDFYGSTDVIRALAIDAQNRIVAGGQVQSSTGNLFALVRYNPDGSLDTTFASGGAALTQPASGNNYLRSVVIGADGGIVADGWNTPPSSSNNLLVLQRFTSAGILNAAFGNGGTVMENFAAWGATGATGYDVMLQANGNILAAGQATVNGGQIGLASLFY